MNIIYGAVIQRVAADATHIATRLVNAPQMMPMDCGIPAMEDRARMSDGTLDQLLVAWSIKPCSAEVTPVNVKTLMPKAVNALMTKGPAIAISQDAQVMIYTLKESASIQAERNAAMARNRNLRTASLSHSGW